MYMYIQTCTCLGDAKTCWTVRQYNPHTLLPPHTGYRGVAGGLTLMPTYIPCAVTRNPGHRHCSVQGFATCKTLSFWTMLHALFLHLKCHMYNHNILNRKHRLIHQHTHTGIWGWIKVFVLNDLNRIPILRCS